MKKTHLATFRNIESEFGPRAEKLTVRRTNGFGKTERKVVIPMSRTRFEELYNDLSDEFNNGTAVEFDANAAERLLDRAGAMDLLDEPRI